MDGTPVLVGGGSAVLPADVLPLAPGDPVTVGGHTLIGRLGAGGMGVVYLGRDEDGRLAAVKVAHTGTVGEEEARARFRDEVASLIRVPSHYTARPLADGTAQTPPYIVTEYVAGPSLKEIIARDGALPPERLRTLATGVLRALAAIHRAGLVHRDLKPANVLMGPTGPRVIDFGIAQSVSAAGGPTETGKVVGSVGWIAPERLARRPASPASDVFCWGCLIAYAGTARNPFGEGDALEMAGRALFEQPDLGGLDPSLRSLVTSALAKDPDDRPTAAQLLARLDPADPLAAGDLADDTATNLTPITDTRRRPRMLAAACVASVAAVAVGTLILPQAVEPATSAGGSAPVRQTHRPPNAADVAVISREPGKTPQRATRTLGRPEDTTPTTKPAGGHAPSSHGKAKGKQQNHKKGPK
ncbi:serine/threonine-protein kinase [Actinoallomurus iriomotensis]|uniref:non-specific serine/threonine protein kinase n=1 Tax=Actinoallomurus iriomotensis TaxID=478107 RepID=A0A9W6SB16_9ACTN|nr:serine/threonine-protein kinase [Actinoallomurus iriomotensis]GLY90328.1 hypothetical protein Airi02_082570 [Actinoallomurus iriomotensis]